MAEVSWARLGAALAALFASGCAAVLFFPEQGLRHTPAAAHLAYEDVRFTSLDGTPLHGWWLKGTPPIRGTILFYHGNAQNIAAHLGSVYWLPERGFDVFLFDYRGFGLSGGTPTLAGAHADARAALRAARERTPGPLFVLGQSIGGALAVHALATEGTDGVRALALDSTFASYRAVTREKLGDLILTWPLQWPLSLFMTERYSPGPVIAGLAPLPLLVMHGGADDIIPIRHGQALFERAGEPKTFVTIAGGKHIATLTTEQGREALMAFLTGVAAVAGPLLP